MCCGANEIETPQANKSIPVQDVFELAACLPAVEVRETVLAHERVNEEAVQLNNIDYAPGTIQLLEFEMDRYSPEDFMLHGRFRFAKLLLPSATLPTYNFSWIKEKVYEAFH